MGGPDYNLQYKFCTFLGQKLGFIFSWQNIASVQTNHPTSQTLLQLLVSYCELFLYYGIQVGLARDKFGAYI